MPQIIFFHRIPAKPAQPSKDWNFPNIEIPSGATKKSRRIKIKMPL
jgi:hypothetical protein